MKGMIIDAIKNTWELGWQLKEILAVGVEFKMLKRVIEHGTGAGICRQAQDLENHEGHVTRDHRRSHSSSSSVSTSKINFPMTKVL